MRIVLRVVAVLALLTVVNTLLFVGHMWYRGGIPLLLQSGTFGFLTVAGWFVTLVAGIPASVLLWRPSDLGRIAAAIVWGSTGLYYLICIGFFHTPNTKYIQILFAIAYSAVLVALVLSPQARQACLPQPLSTGEPA